MSIKNLEINEDAILAVALGIVVTSTIVGTIAFFTGNSKCDIDVRHKHLYKSDNLQGYFESEKRFKSFMSKQDEYKEITWDSADLDEKEKIISKYNLISIYDNMEYLMENATSDNRYTEYEYKDTYYETETYQENNETKTKRVKKTRYLYTKEIKNSLDYTGNARDKYNTYNAYKIEKVDNKYKVIESEEVTNLLDPDVLEYYPYIKPNYINYRTSDKYKVDIKTLKK